MIQTGLSPTTSGAALGASRRRGYTEKGVSSLNVRDGLPTEPKTAHGETEASSPSTGDCAAVLAKQHTEPHTAHGRTEASISHQGKLRLSVLTVWHTEPHTAHGAPEASSPP